MLNDIQAELKRISAHQVHVTLDDDFKPDAGTLVRIQRGDAYWHMSPEQFLAILQDLSPEAGDEGVQRAIETKGQQVWHGPATETTRERMR